MSDWASLFPMTPVRVWLHESMIICQQHRLTLEVAMTYNFTFLAYEVLSSNRYSFN